MWGRFLKKNFKSTSDLENGKHNGYQGDLIVNLNLFLDWLFTEIAIGLKVSFVYNFTWSSIMVPHGTIVLYGTCSYNIGFAHEHTIRDQTETVIK